MNIAIIGHLRYPIGEPFAGGLEKHTHLLATELTRRGHKVTLYARPGSGPGYTVYPYDPADYMTDPRIDLTVARQDAYNAICDDIAAGDYDLIHNNSLHYVPMMRAHQLGAPVVQVLHTPMLDDLVSAAAIARRHGSIRYISVSDVTGRDWAEHIGEYEVVGNGIQLLRWRYSSRPVPGLVAYVGRIVPEKGVHFAIDAARLAGKQMLIAGPLSDMDYFREKIEPRLDEERRYVGHLKLLETAQLLSNAECSVFSSVWDEPFGLVLAESLTCGTPVAGFDVGAAREVLNDDTGVLVPEGDVEALAAAIHEATQLDRRACRRRAMERFSLTAMVDAYEDIYRQEAKPRRIGERSKGGLMFPAMAARASARKRQRRA